MNSLWLARPLPQPTAAWKLYCFPWSGAGAGVFRDWPGLAGDDIDVCSVTYPGRERRFNEAALTSVEAIADGILPELLDDIDRPYALFGHSLGAQVVHACARRLTEQGRGPVWAFVAGSPPPGTRRGPLRHTLGDRAFLRAVASALDGPDEMLSDPDFAAMILPTMRADIRAAEIYGLTAGAGLDCPVTTFAGTRDPRATPDDMRLWQSLAAGGFASEEIDGDHMFVTGSGAAAIVSVIAATLATAADRYRPAAPATR
jgi:medium-chain acyl-[acyl-carrier-protein] hydrolase